MSLYTCYTLPVMAAKKELLVEVEQVEMNEEVTLKSEAASSEIADYTRKR